MRSLDRDESRLLKPGSDHYTAYVGPPAQYDFMGATQFRLLTTLGLREQHRVLDLGCGSLRAGRLLIPYLLPDRYFGIEPNRWLIDEGIAQELGESIREVKRPRFDDNANFQCDVFDTDFDFIVAQSIFSHATPGLVSRALANMAGSLASGGLLVITFIEAENGDASTHPEGWVYPECVTYSRPDVAGLVRDAGLVPMRIPWFHPRQTWYLAAAEPTDLPTEADLEHLVGAVLRDPEFRRSLES